MRGVGGPQIPRLHSGGWNDTRGNVQEKLFGNGPERSLHLRQRKKIQKMLRAADWLLILDMMFDHARLHVENHLFGNVGGQIRDALQIA